MNEERQAEDAAVISREREETPTVTVVTAGARDPHGATPAGAAADLAKVRELVLQAHPEVVPDLIRGTSVDELLASVEPTRAAYQRIADWVRDGQSTAVTAAAGATGSAAGEMTGVVQPPQVPAGGGAANPATESGGLSPEGKIARALAERRRT